MGQTINLEEDRKVLTFLAFLFVLGALVLVHELGHFLVAKALGIRVLVFSFGFGPKLLKGRLGETEYALSLFPLGGYVKLLGEEAEEDIPPQQRDRSFAFRPLWQRALVVGAGPISNLVFSSLLFALIFFTGVPRLLPVVGEVVVGYPAQKAGLKPGDRILSIQEEKVNYWDDLLRIIPKSEGKPLKFHLKRDGEELHVVITPQAVKVKDIFGEERTHYQIGILPRGDFVKVKWKGWESLRLGFKETLRVSELVIVGIGKILSGAISAKSVGGPIMIAQMAGQEAKKGFQQLIFFTAIVGVNIGLLNLFPIPILDGGHLLLYGLQALLRRSFDPKKLELLQKIGLVIIVLLMLFAFYNDLLRVWGQIK